MPLKPAMPGSSFIAGPDDSGKRLDRVVRALFPAQSLGILYKAIRKGSVKVNNNRKKVDYRVQPGDIITVPLPGHISQHLLAYPGFPERGSPEGTEAGKTDSQKMKKQILFENDSVLAINKPRGWLSHGKNSLEEQVRDYLTDSWSRSLSFRPGPLHRLDRNTSGIILYGKSLEGARHFTRLLQEKQLEKIYLGVLDGVIPQPVRWEDSLTRIESRLKTIKARGSASEQPVREAVLELTPLLWGKSHTLCRFQLVTGRTHQIRAQAAIHHHPLAGDKKYDGSSLRGGYILHAYSLNLKQDDPLLGFHTLTAPFPETSYTSLARMFDTGLLHRTLGNFFVVF